MRTPLGMSSIASLLTHWMALAAWVLPRPTPAGGARWTESGANETACSAIQEKVYPRRMTMRRGPECADMHVRFGCVSVRRSHANAALHVISSRHPIKPLHTRSNARVSCLVCHGNRKNASQARCVCAALPSACLCVQTHLGDKASRSMRCDRSDLRLVRLLANASQCASFSRLT